MSALSTRILLDIQLTVETFQHCNMLKHPEGAYYIHIHRYEWNTYKTAERYLTATMKLLEDKSMQANEKLMGKS